MSRMDDMLGRYGECVTYTQTAKILSRTTPTIKRMLEDGRLRWACGGTMVDVRSIADYIEMPAAAEERGRKARSGRKWMV